MSNNKNDLDVADFVETDKTDKTNNTDSDSNSDSNSNSDNDDEFETVDDLANNQNLIKCYQMQIDDDNHCEPVFLGQYPDVPLPVNKIIKYKKYNLHIVTYVLTEEEIQNNIFKIVGMNVFRQGRNSSLYSLDLSLKSDKTNYQLLFSDHKKGTTDVVEELALNMLPKKKRDT